MILGVYPGDIISLFADTTDNSPLGQSATSRTIHLQVISVDDYNNFLRREASVEAIQQKYYDIAERMHDLGEEQEKLNQEMTELKKKMNDKKNPLSDAEQRAALNKIIKKQNEINHKTKQLVKDMKKMEREKPLYDIEKEFAEEFEKAG